MTNLVTAIDLAQQANEKRIAAEIGLPSPEPTPTDALLHLRRFHSFCKARGVKFIPATPAIVAAYVRAEIGADIYPESILNALKAIEDVHDQNNLASPVCATVVRNEIALIPGLAEKGPRSWKKEERSGFWLLPAPVREIILRRDRDASTTLRKAQNDAAELRHKVKSLQPKGIENAEFQKT